MTVLIFLEGGAAKSKDLKSRCHEGFAKLLEKSGYQRPTFPKLRACGSRSDVFKAFQAASRDRAADFVAMWIDSEDPLEDLVNTWRHLNKRDGWVRPPGATEEQVLFMTTCMETIICADRKTLRTFYGAKLRESALPPVEALERRDRHDVQEKLERATRECSNAYAKGKRSFEVLGELDPATLRKRLPSFNRIRQILDTKLKS